MSQSVTDGRAWLSERAEVAAAARGERWAFESLVRQLTPRMCWVAPRIVGEPVDVEEVVQDAWIAVWRALLGYRGIGGGLAVLGGD